LESSVVIGCQGNMKNHKNKGKKKGLSLTFKWGTKQDYVIQTW